MVVWLEIWIFQLVLPNTVCMCLGQVEHIAKGTIYTTNIDHHMADTCNQVHSSKSFTIIKIKFVFVLVYMADQQYMRFVNTMKQALLRHKM